MLKIKSTNAACYITIKTEKLAKVKTSEHGLNYFEFERLPQIMKAYSDYRKTVDKKRESRTNVDEFIEKDLKVDLNKFNNIFNIYKEMSAN